VYSTITFVEKNKDEVPGEADALMQASAVPLLAHVFQFAAEEAAAAARAAEAKSGGKRSKSGGSVSVSAQFKGQLSSLMEKIYSTSPHYVRCLKPNDENVSDNFNRLRTTEQLRYGGVLEAVRVARSGFPVRLSHSDFYSRYRPLANPFSDLTAKMPRHIFSESPAKTQEYLDMLIMALWDTTTPDDTTTTPGTRRKSRAADLSIWSGAYRSNCICYMCLYVL
jgi:myosin heavy subunit